VKRSLPVLRTPFQRSVYPLLTFSQKYIKYPILISGTKFGLLRSGSATLYGWCLHPPLRMAGGNIRHFVWLMVTSATPYGG